MTVADREDHEDGGGWAARAMLGGALEPGIALHRLNVSIHGGCGVPAGHGLTQRSAGGFGRASPQVRGTREWTRLNPVTGEAELVDFVPWEEVVPVLAEFAAEAVHAERAAVKRKAKRKAARKARKRK